VQHEAQDAARFVEWGFDFLKYDWCSYSETPRPKPDPELEAPAEALSPHGGILKQQPRDIVFNLCQYGMARCGSGAPRWAGTPGGRRETWLEKNERPPRLLLDRLQELEHSDYAGPGHWNDRTTSSSGTSAMPTTSKSAEAHRADPQRTVFLHVDVGADAAPLFYSGDITRSIPSR